MIGIKAIETRYKGYRFRSRLEARWAVFFDSLKLEWEYEPEGYYLGNGELYLPDFKLTCLKEHLDITQELFVEIKSNQEHEFTKGLEKARNFYMTTGFSILVLSGSPYHKNYNGIGFFKEWVGTHIEFLSLWTDPTISFCFRAIELKTPPLPFSERMKYLILLKTNSSIQNNLSNLKRDFIDEAYVAARSARFEHGESPL